MKILVVDDSVTMRRIVRRSLRQAGYGDSEVVEASDGAEALEAIDKDQFDLVLSDVNMPNMTGLELLTELKSRERKPVVVMVTSEAKSAMASELRENGAAACIAKPFNASDLGRVLDELFS